MTDQLLDAIQIARAQLKIDEGLRLKPYKDTEGNWTIGYGRNLSEGISIALAEQMLSEDLIVAHSDARMVVGQVHFDAATPKRQAALINMAFNLGRTRLLKFRSMIELIRQGRWEAASNAALASIWASQVGTRATRIAGALRDG